MSSHRFHRFAQNFLLSVFSHGFHRFTQILMVRCSPTEFTEYTEFGSVGMAGMPYPPKSVNICVICGRLFSARSFCEFRAFCGNLFPPTDFSLGGYGILPYPRHLLWDILPQNTPNSQNLLMRCPPTYFTDLHRYLGCAVLPQTSQTSQNLAAWVWQECHTLLICAHPCHLWEALLCQKFLCVPCVLWESLSSHGFHRFTQMLRVRCSPTEFTEFTEFGSVGMAGMPYPPTSVRIRAICGRLFSARGSVSSVLICGSFFTACSVGAAETAAPPGGIHGSSAHISPPHHLTTTTSFHLEPCLLHVRPVLWVRLRHYLRLVNPQPREHDCRRCERHRHAVVVVRVDRL